MSPLRSRPRTCLSKTGLAPHLVEKQQFFGLWSFSDWRGCGRPAWSRSSFHCLVGRELRSGRKVAPLLLRVCSQLYPLHRALSQWLFHLSVSHCCSQFQLSARPSQSLTLRGLFLAIVWLFSQRVYSDTSFERVRVFCLSRLFAPAYLCCLFQSLQRLCRPSFRGGIWAKRNHFGRFHMPRLVEQIVEPCLRARSGMAEPRYPWSMLLPIVRLDGWAWPPKFSSSSRSFVWSWSKCWSWTHLYIARGNTSGGESRKGTVRC